MHFHWKLNYAWQGSWSKKKRGREMDGEGKRRGEDPPTLRDGGRWRGGEVGRAKEIK